MSAVLKPAMRRAWPRQKIAAALYHDFVRNEHAVDGVRKALADIWTFERDSAVNGWERENRANLLNEFAIDEPAFVIDPATGQALGYRALAGFTNSLLDNRDLSTGNWTQVSSADLTIAQDSVGMDGVANSAHTITDTDASGNNRIVQSVSVPDDSDTHAVVFPVRKDSDESRFPEFRVELTGGTTVEHRIMVNTATGEKNEQRTDGTGAVEDWGEWWGVSVAIPNNGSGNTALSYEIWPARTDTFGSYSATSGSIVYDFGGVYLNSEAGPPIETEGSPVSTAADDASEPLPASCQDGFVLVTKARTPDVVDGFTLLNEIDDGGGVTNRIRLAIVPGNNMRVIVEDDGGDIVDMTDSADVGNNSDVSVAIRMESGRFALCVNGGTPVTDATVGFPTALSQHLIGMTAPDSQVWNSTIASVYFDGKPEDWTDADLQDATS